MEREKESMKDWKRLVRMNEQDRISQASSLATISSFPVQGKGIDGKVQSFGKRARAVKRDPNCPVVIRGWLYKQDSSGLKLWKRRWFVLSDFCLFYYKDSREESVLGSIPLPSYNILFCTPRECKHRKYAFKAVHRGMRSYVFSADTQEDMLGWVRALSQSANMEMEGSLNRRCSSYQDFTRIGGSSDSLALSEAPVRNGPTHLTAPPGSGPQIESGALVGGRMGTPRLEHRGRQKSTRQSPSSRTSTPTNPGGHRRRGQSLSQETTEQDTLPLNCSHQTPPQTLRPPGPSPLTPRGHLGSRPHTPVGRVDIRPHDDPLFSPPSIGSSPPSPNMDFGSYCLTPPAEKRHTPNRPVAGYSSQHPAGSSRRAAGKPATPNLFQERDQQQMRSPESEVDAVLTRLCGCDKLLQSLALEMAEVQADKDNVQCALEMARLQLEEWKGQGFRGQGVRGHDGLLSQKALLLDDLVTIRAKMCDISMEMERVWCQYERMESELSVLRSHLQHICRFGRTQDKSHAQRELWMMEDILCGLRANRNYFRNMLRLPRQIGATGPQTDESQNDPSMALYSVLSSHHRSEQSRENSSVLSGDRKKSENTPGSLPGHTPFSWSTPDPTVKKGRMSEEEQRERMKRNQQRPPNQKKAPASSPTDPPQAQRPSPPTEEPPFPLRVTRVLTAVLPSALVARRVAVEDPPHELATPLPEQISPGYHQLAPDQNRKHQRRHREPFLEERHQNSNRTPTEVTEDARDRSLAFASQEPSSETTERKSNLPHAPRELPLHRHTTATEDDSSLSPQKSPESSPSETQGTEKSPLPEASGAEPENCPRRRRCDWPGPGNGSLHPDLRPREENGCSAFTSGEQANGRGEKVAGRGPFLVSDQEVDPEHCLTPEQRDAKLRRVERIRARVIRSAVRENNVQPNCQQTGDNTERQTKHSSALLNSASKRQRAAASGDIQERCGVEEVNCDHCSHSYKDPDLCVSVTAHPYLKGHRGNTDVGSWHNRGAPRKNFLSSNHITKLTVFQANESPESTQGAGNGRPFHHVTNKIAEPTGNQNETSFSPTNRRAEWFLSTNQMVRCIPLINPVIQSVTDENALSEDHIGTTCDFTIQHAVTDASSEGLPSAANQSPAGSEEDASRAFPRPEGTETIYAAIRTSSPKNPPEHNRDSTPIGLADGTKGPDNPDPDVTQQLTSLANQKEEPRKTSIECEEPQNLAGALNKQEESRPDSGCDTVNTVACKTPEPITPYATINFDAARGSSAEANAEVVLSGEPQDPPPGGQDTCQALHIVEISHPSQKSKHELHIYEEIAYGGASRDDRSQKCPEAVGDLPPSDPLPVSLPGNSASPPQSAETATETGNGPSAEVRTESGGTDESPEPSEREGKEVRLRRDHADPNSKLNNGNDSPSPPFTKTRVTVVRTSL